MAAYAALVSLMNIIDHIKNHPRFSISIFDKKQVESFVERIGFLLDFIENNHSHGVLSKEEIILESQIACAAYAAEDAIESNVVHQINSGLISLLDLVTIIQDMDFVKDKVVNVNKEETRIFNDHQHGPTYSLSTPTSSTDRTEKSTTMVGFDDKMIQLMDALTGHKSSLQIIPIVGMGGIGKTTLARNLYENRLIIHHFDIRAWTTISQEYSARNVFTKLLSCQSESNTRSDRETSEVHLAQHFYQSLIGRRYLIILDDMWSIEAWDQIKFFFPDNNNGSRIVLTTRLSNVATHFGSSYLSMEFLDEDKSWKLLCEKTFSKEGCPSELEKVANKIARKCKGLPLFIVVIGGLLRKSSRTKELWENISKDINSIPSSQEYQESLDVLSLSYTHLPAHLKPCFLYMGTFPEDHEILVSKLIRLWVAEGLLRPNKTELLEVIAESYLKDLVDRNLVLVRRLGPNGKIKTCNIHDLLRDLCLKVAQKEKFLHVMGVFDLPKDVAKERRIVCHDRFPNQEHRHELESVSLTRSLISKGGASSFKSKLLRVMNVVMMSYSSLDDIFKNVNLLYLLRPYSWAHRNIPLQLPSSKSQLWNLQTLTITHDVIVSAPSEIWEMPQLRHVEVKYICLLEPFLSDDRHDHDVIVLRNLQTLKEAEDLRLSEEVCKRMPNIIRKLSVMLLYYNLECYQPSSLYSCLYDFGSLRKLGSLKCCFMKTPSRSDLLRNLTFPSH